MIEHPYVGQKCRINELGFEQCGKVRNTLDFESSQNLTITKVDSEPYTFGDGTVIISIEVDDPQWNANILDNHMVEALL